MAVHAAVILLVLCAIYFAYPFNSLFSWHPLCMVVGLYGFSFQGIVIYNKFSSLVPTAAASRKYKFHVALQTLGVLTILVGSAVIYKVKVDNNRPHLASWHGILGFIFVLYGLSQVIFGFIKSRFFLRRWIKVRTFRQLHAMSGAVFFCLGSLVTGLGFRSKWFQQKALVDSIQDQGVRLLINYVLNFLFCLLAMVATKQVYDRYFAGIETSVTSTSTPSKRSKRAK